MVPTFERAWSFKETNLRIKCDLEPAIDAAIEAALQARRDIERLILREPEFRWSLEPLDVPGEHPRVVELMLLAGAAADVGPFAAVAGAVAQVSAEAAQEAGARNVIIENGGDIFIAGDREFRVGIFAGASEGSGKLGFAIKPSELPIGVCTSSGTVGHSLSFGWADAAVAVADDAATADAAATSIGNAVTGDDIKESVRLGLERGRQIESIRGCLVARGDQVGAWGRIPELFKVEPVSAELAATSAQYRAYGRNLKPAL